MCFRPTDMSQEKKCPECGEQVGALDTECANCGAELPSMPAMPGAPGAPGAPAAPGMPGAPGAPAAPKAPGM